MNHLCKFGHRPDKTEYQICVYSYKIYKYHFYSFLHSSLVRVGFAGFAVCADFVAYLSLIHWSAILSHTSMVVVVVSIAVWLSPECRIRLFILTSNFAHIFGFIHG